MKNKYNNINIDINEVDITNEIIGVDTTINIENNTDNINQIIRDCNGNIV